MLTVLVFRPLPRPVMRRPTIKCAKEKADACRIAPTIIMLEPRKMVLRLPRGWPMKMVKAAPTKHPRLYDATEIPVIAGQNGYE